MSSISLRLAASTSRAARLVPAWTFPRQIRSRNIHQRKDLPYNVEEGMGHFLPSESLRMIAVDYQQGLLDRLNEQVRGTDLEGKSVVQTVIEAARNPSKILEFNYASEALNNSFFLGNLKPPQGDTTSHEGVLEGSRLYGRIALNYGTLDHLKSTFSAAVLGMFSSGWLWFVCDQTGSLGIYPTFGPGTLLVRSRVPKPLVYVYGEDARDPLVEKARALAAAKAASSESASSANAPSSPTSGISHTSPPLNPGTPSRPLSSSAIHRLEFKPSSVHSTDPAVSEDLLNETENITPKVGEVLYPLFCVSVHEHAWVSAGYGVWGKEEYMKRFWTVLNWAKVEDTYVSCVGSKLI
ncbi:manganese and iron superoxide dismutase [Sparassis crispa]|uniref:Manganese and iron superoxide dismutase n=1 Tax=Sparassis crispa TaxID=139825 RepID=A0A401GAK8_9APHY|nr:manganese and iron superoxide dismutase [Sparassis crispa]GBE79216.1 manganese and iron superoxide dismutase [Sparassis crispa]